MNAILDRSALDAAQPLHGDGTHSPRAAYPEPDDRKFLFGWWLLPASVVGAALWFVLYLAVRALLP